MPSKAGGFDGILGILQRGELAASLPGGLAARRVGPRPDEQGEIELAQRSTGAVAIITASTPSITPTS